MKDPAFLVEAFSGESLLQVLNRIDVIRGK